VFEHGACLQKSDAREQGHDLANWYTVFEVLEEGRYGHTRAAEHPSSA
jgi:hypothetical protein